MQKKEQYSGNVYLNGLSQCILKTVSNLAYTIGGARGGKK